MTDEPTADRPQPPNEPIGRSVLFVCTGNTCRSPLAEVLCRKMLAERLGIAESDLAARGYTVRSAGIAAFPGDAASPEAVAIAAQFGADLSAHRSRPVNPELLATSTDVLAMTSGHLAVLMARYPSDGPEPTLLAGSHDVPDPIGGTRDDYEHCAALIAALLDQRIAEWTRT
jgi:protein-tyrosine-phosphatase